jgi:hypothetical protein
MIGFAPMDRLAFGDAPILMRGRYLPFYGEIGRMRLQSPVFL